jgi:hypothetical protein
VERVLPVEVEPHRKAPRRRPGLVGALRLQDATRAGSDDHGQAIPAPPSDRTGHLVVETGEYGDGHASKASVEGRQGPGQGFERPPEDPAHGLERQIPRTGLESGAALLQGARNLLNVRAQGVPDGETRHGEGHERGRIAHRSSS